MQFQYENGLRHCWSFGLDQMMMQSQHSFMESRVSRWLDAFDKRTLWEEAICFLNDSQGQKRGTVASAVVSLNHAGGSGLASKFSRELLARLIPGLHVITSQWGNFWSWSSGEFTSPFWILGWISVVNIWKA
jgi:hypothetical protein